MTRTKCQERGARALSAVKGMQFGRDIFHLTVIKLDKKIIFGDSKSHSPIIPGNQSPARELNCGETSAWKAKSIPVARAKHYSGLR